MTTTMAMTTTMVTAMARWSAGRGTTGYDDDNDGNDGNDDDKGDGRWAAAQRDMTMTTMAMDDDDNKDEDGVTRTPTTTTMVTARRTKGYNNEGGKRHRQRGRWQRSDGRR